MDSFYSSDLPRATFFGIDVANLGRLQLYHSSPEYLAGFYLIIHPFHLCWSVVRSMWDLKACPPTVHIVSNPSSYAVLPCCAQGFLIKFFHQYCRMFTGMKIADGCARGRQVCIWQSQPRERLSVTFAGGNKRTGEVTIHPGINGTAVLHSRHFIKLLSSATWPSKGRGGGVVVCGMKQQHTLFWQAECRLLISHLCTQCWETRPCLNTAVCTCTFGLILDNLSSVTPSDILPFSPQLLGTFDVGTFFFCLTA